MHSQQARANSSAAPVSNHTRHRSTSSEFGAFTQALRPSTVPPPTQLGEHDLLGSFEDEADQRPMNAMRPSSASGPSTRDLPSGPARRPLPILINLPPRPFEISADYDPNSQEDHRQQRFTGPSSPPAISEANVDVSPQKFRRSGSDAASEFRRIRRSSIDQATTLGRGSSRQGGEDAAHHSAGMFGFSPTKASIASTIATTSKMANKWRTAITPSTFHPDFGDPRGEPSTVSKTALPIDITHDSPFASAEQIAFSYTAPSGAPGFKPKAAQTHDDDWSTTTRAEELMHTHLVGRRESTMPILDSLSASELRQSLPPRQKLSDTWRLLFSLDQHGASLNTLYNQVAKYAATNRTSGNVLIVKDSDGNTFGVFLNEPIVKREGTYYGSGESFLFKSSSSRPSHFQTFKWTGRNQYFALCETSLISFGGGDGAYGLLLDSTFSRNTSATCPTYNNGVLCRSDDTISSKAASFDCVGVEVWATT